MQTDEFLPDKAFFYIILNGDFKVSGLNFNKKAKKTPQEKILEAQLEAEALAIKQAQGIDISEIQSVRKQKKLLVSGDYFGEVSFLYKCRRTATIKAKLYATLGVIDHVLFPQIIRDYPDFKS